MNQQDFLQNTIKTFEQYKKINPDGTEEKYKIIEKLTKELAGIDPVINVPTKDYSSYLKEQLALGKSGADIFDAFKHHSWTCRSLHADETNLLHGDADITYLAVSYLQHAFPIGHRLSNELFSSSKLR